MTAKQAKYPVSNWTGAEVHAELALIGMNLEKFAAYKNWDFRTLRREATGKTPVFQRTVDSIKELKERYFELVDEIAEQEEWVDLPRLGSTKNGIPASMWHAAFADARLDNPSLRAYYEEV